jgi:hypothetical protein
VILVCLALTLAADDPAGTIRAALSLRDETAVRGRTTVLYRQLELADSPVSTGPFPPSPEGRRRFGLLRTEPDREHPRLLIWDRAEDGRSTYFFDSNDDGAIGPGETVEPTEQEIALPLRTDEPHGPDSSVVSRTLLLRMAADGGELYYAVRGFASGLLESAGSESSFVCLDADADGHFDSAGVDRLWIDQDQDGQFSPLVQQFLIGSPVEVSGETYVTRVDAEAGEIVFSPKRTQTGRIEVMLRTDLTDTAGQARITLVSDQGEWFSLRSSDGPVTVPAGTYLAREALVERADAGGTTWSFTFQGRKEWSLVVPPDTLTVLGILDGLTLGAGVYPRERTADAVVFVVTPQLQTPRGLFLTSCLTRSATDGRTSPTSGTVVVLNGAGLPVGRLVSGFA